jgi:hypothetical protein
LKPSSYDKTNSSFVVNSPSTFSISIYFKDLGSTIIKLSIANGWTHEHELVNVNYEHGYSEHKKKNWVYSYHMARIFVTPKQKMFATLVVYSFLRGKIFPSTWMEHSNWGNNVPLILVRV